MNRHTIAMCALPLVLSACASYPAQDGFAGVRTVFHNPYTDPVVDDRMIGPDQERNAFGIDGRWIDGLFYPGVGRFAYDRNGNVVRLSRRDRRILRQRARDLREQERINQAVADFNRRNAGPSPQVPAPVPSAPPVSAPPVTSAPPVMTPPPAVSAPPQQGDGSSYSRSNRVPR